MPTSITDLFPPSHASLPPLTTSSSTTALSPISSPSPRDPNLPDFSENLGPSLSPISTPVHPSPYPPLLPGTELLHRVGRPFLQSLAHRFRPFIFLHSQEPCRPCSIEWYLQHSDLFHGDTLIATAEELTPALLGDERELERRKLKAQLETSHTPPSLTPPSSFTSSPPLLSPSRPPRLSKAVRHNKFNLRLRPPYRGGLPFSSLPSIPVYCYIRDYPTHFEILYIFCYAFNAPYRVLGCWLLGAHDGDFEHITLRIAKPSLSLTSVYYAAHGWRDGQWRHSPSIPLKGERPVVFIARGSHATYPEEGRWLRIWAGANDLCERGVEWDPSVVLLHVGDGSEEDERVRWLHYGGWWEFEGINSVHQQRWWYEEPTTSNSVIRRMFCAFMPKYMGMEPEMWALKEEDEKLRRSVEGEGMGWGGGDSR